MSNSINDDEYIASLLTQEAKNAKKTYELVGLDAFSSKRPKSGAPKPNTNFLRHIIRQTDNHNAALLAKEAEESNARLREMNRERLRGQRYEEIKKERKADGRLTPALSDEDARAPVRRTNHEKRRERPAHSHQRKHRSRSRETRREKRRRDVSHERPSRRSEHDRERHSRRKNVSDSEGDISHKKHKSTHRRRRHRSSSRSSSNSRSRHPRADRIESKRTRSRSPHRTSSSRRPELRKESDKSKRRSPTPDSDSDPLEAIIGPLPPNVQPTIRSRGRGAHKASSMGMDSRFSSTYDPSIDTRLTSDAEGDWEENLESFRDRQRWKQQGAERLKAAGFTDAQVKKWEKGGEKDEEDVTWTKRGQAREWDRGKVVDEDGDVELKAEWGRLK